MGKVPGRSGAPSSSSVSPKPIWSPSPNFGPRRGGLVPHLVVLHYTAMDTAEAALERLCDPAHEVSAHYLIGADGRIWQMVKEDQRAWHAGAGEWAGQDDINSRSIGIELDNRGDHPFANLQMCALEVLLSEILARWAIPCAGVIGHSCMAPGRKCDPGPRFDWQRLARLGLAEGSRLDPATQEALRTSDNFRKQARELGFTAPVKDEALREAVNLRYGAWSGSI